MDTLDEDDIAKLEETQANWLTQGQLCELKRKATEKMGQHYLQECAKVQFNNFGMWGIVFKFHENQARTKLFQMWVASPWKFCENNNFSGMTLMIYSEKLKYSPSGTNFQMQWLLSKWPGLNIWGIAMRSNLGRRSTQLHRNAKIILFWILIEMTRDTQCFHIIRRTILFHI